MNPRKKPITILLTFVIALAIIWGVFYYISGVRQSLWNKSVTDILEVTTQGSHALDTYFGKDYDTLHLFTSSLSKISASDHAAIQKQTAIFDEESANTYVCIDLTSGTAYTNTDAAASTVSPDLLDQCLTLPEQGMRNPFLNQMTGVRSLGVYERFTFADGTPGLAQKIRPLQAVAERFSLSFYNDTGFSYVINTSGDVLLRTNHPNSNRTFQNLFDIIDLEGNDTFVVESFRQSLAQGQQGVALFKYNATDYAFCYVPLSSAPDWYVVSIVPNAIIMEQANNIIQSTLILCAFILLTLFLIGLAIQRQNTKHRKEIEQLAYYDSLTGLFRYEKFQLDGEELLKHSSLPFAVLYADVEGFKLLNDLEGYQFGDELLKQLAALLRNIARPEDLLCRISGDDFLLFTHYTSRDEILPRCQQLLKLSSERLAQNRTIHVRIGVCLSEDAPEAQTISALVDRARIAQKNAANEAWSAVHFYNQDMRQALLKDAEIENKMHKALENGEFIYYIQPKYAADGSSILGGEALVRWQKPDGTLISPQEFIPLFERNGFICKVDEAIFTQVCAALHSRLENNQAVVPISVNVSRIHLYWPDFAQTYIAIKKAYQIPDQLIELELTESSLLENTAIVFSTLNFLRQNGFLCSIDDFGSGYSSLNALKDLPADILKLDRQFLTENAAPAKSEIIIRSIIGMAKRLSLATVAEGVETPSQLAFLRDTGCDMIQGFIFSKPLPPEAFYQLLSQTNTP